MIYIDPKELNKALKQERYPIPVIEDVLPELSKARVFTKVDGRNEYWYVVLNEESATLMTCPLGITTGEDYLSVLVSRLKISRNESTKL